MVSPPVVLPGRVSRPWLTGPQYFPSCPAYDRCLQFDGGVIPGDEDGVLADPDYIEYPGEYACWDPDDPLRPTAQTQTNRPVYRPRVKADVSSEEYRMRNLMSTAHAIESATALASGKGLP